MEYDLILKHFLTNDNRVNKIEAKLSIDFLKCKIDNCHSKGIKKIYTHEDYEECKELCLDNLNKFSLMKQTLYRDFSKFYYEKFLLCSNEIEDINFNKCIQDTKFLMNKNVEDIKKIVLNFEFYS